MKNPVRRTLALFTACTVLPAAGLLAQAPSPAAATTPSVSAPAPVAAPAGEEHEGGHMKAFSKLTPEEQAKLKAAHKIAKDDPAVKAAEAQRGSGKEGHKAYQDAMHAAMLKADPTIGPILEKMKEERHEDRLHKKDLK